VTMMLAPYKIGRLADYTGRRVLWHFVVQPTELCSTSTSTSTSTQYSKPSLTPTNYMMIHQPRRSSKLHRCRPQTLALQCSPHTMNGTYSLLPNMRTQQPAPARCSLPFTHTASSTCLLLPDVCRPCSLLTAIHTHSIQHVLTAPRRLQALRKRTRLKIPGDMSPSATLHYYAGEECLLPEHDVLRKHSHTLSNASTATRSSRS